MSNLNLGCLHCMREVDNKQINKQTSFQRKKNIVRKMTMDDVIGEWGQGLANLQEVKQKIPS